MDEQEFESVLAHILEEVGSAQGGPFSSVRLFNEAGLLTDNHGVVVRTEDGSVFQITIVRSR